MEKNKKREFGTRNYDDLRVAEAYLRSGRVPFGLMMKKGLKSLFFDPWFTFLKHLTGPMGFKLRQLLYRRWLGSAGKGVVIDPDVDIWGPENVYLDDFAYLGKGSSLVANEGYIKIGKRCHICGWVLGHGGVEIGDYVAIGNSSILSATDSHQGGFRMAGPMIPAEQRNIKKKKVVIENDTFVGHFCTVMPGVRIGEGAVIAPNSLVLRNVEPWTVVMGSPAVVVSRRQKVRFPNPD